jgi:hypothetical protein
VSLTSKFFLHPIQYELKRDEKKPMNASGHDHFLSKIEIFLLLDPISLILNRVKAFNDFVEFFS